MSKQESRDDTMRTPKIRSSARVNGHDPHFSRQGDRAEDAVIEDGLKHVTCANPPPVLYPARERHMTMSFTAEESRR